MAYVAGRFFLGVSGLQFAAPSTLGRLRAGLPESGHWWQAATDPASLCGIELPPLRSALPRRSAGTLLAWRGHRVAAIFRRSGREIEFRVPAEDAGLAELVEPLSVALTRAFDPERGVEVETINGEPAGRSGYLPAFGRFSVTREAVGVRLRRRFA